MSHLNSLHLKPQGGKMKKKTVIGEKSHNRIESSHKHSDLSCEPYGLESQD